MKKEKWLQNQWKNWRQWKINFLLKTVQRTPFTGDGKPEPLKGGLNSWSRRINDKDRLVYNIQKDNINIIQCKGHYQDK